MPQLSISDVCKSFGAAPVLVNHSLDVEEGEFVALLGPSGCGKSTLLQIVAGLLPADSGRIVLDGQDITGRTGSGRGMVFQGADLFPWRSAIENVAFGLQVAGVPKRERLERARYYLDLVGLRPSRTTGRTSSRAGCSSASASPAHSASSHVCF
ncbi:ABC-type taurine transport system ATPase subunit [Bradyrhizobium sp. GM5.1]